MFHSHRRVFEGRGHAETEFTLCSSDRRRLGQSVQDVEGLGRRFVYFAMSEHHHIVHDKMTVAPQEEPVNSVLLCDIFGFKPLHLLSGAMLR